MTIAETSKQAYQQLDQDKEMSQADLVFEAIHQYSDRDGNRWPTCNELSNGPLAHLPQGRISARINKLKDQGRIQAAEKRKDKWTNRKAKTWKPMVTDL